MRIKRFITLALLVCSLGAFAQQMAIPSDPEVRSGKLANGLTYYIRHNGWPEHRVNFYIAQRVGSIQEEESQRGLAHFLEHMAFNGSENYPNNGVIEYTRSLGVQFGRDLNAYTGVDQTVYNINDVPSTRQSALDSCLLILRDWSCGLLLEGEEIDKERGVIHEEWRVRSSAEQRMLERNLETLYPGSKYGKRMPIGLMSVVDNFKYNELRDYYHKWYRPDNQAIVVVGDVDVDYTEAKIKEMFGPIPAPAADAAQVVDEPVPDNEDMIVVVDNDKEQQLTRVALMFKHEPLPDQIKGDITYLIAKYAIDMASHMLDKRFDEKSQQDPNCPFVQAGSYDGAYIYSKTAYAFNVIGLPKPGKNEATTKVLAEEVLRAVKHGFTATEYARAREEYISKLEKQYNSRNQTNNETLGRQYCANFLSKEPIPSIEWRYKTMSMLAPNIPVEAVNQVMQQLISTTDKNVVILNFNPAGAEQAPAEAMKAAVNAAQGEELEAYVDNVKDEPLIGEMPTAGSIVSEKENTQLGFTELTLSNGATVILKKTTFKDDEVVMQAKSAGGSSLYGPEDWANTSLFDLVIEYSGLGNFSKSELDKALAGKQAKVVMDLGTSYEELEGQSTVKDLETMFQLLYLKFTAVNKDEKSVNSILGLIRNSLENKGTNPEAVYADSVNYTISAHDWRDKPFNVEDLDKLDYDRTLEIAKERYANAGDFTFFFVGNFDDATIRDLITKYVASLPASDKRENYKNVSKRPTGHVVNQFDRKMETPKAFARMYWYTDKAPYTLENSIKAKIAGQVLSMIYLKKIREDAGAAYSPGARGSVGKEGDVVFTTVVGNCSLKPEQSELVLKIMREAIHDMTKEIDNEQFTNVKEQLLKDYDTDAKDNEHWMSVLSSYKFYGIDRQTTYKDIVNRITKKDISDFLKNVVLKSGNCVEVIMLPTE